LADVASGSCRYDWRIKWRCYPRFYPYSVNRPFTALTEKRGRNELGTGKRPLEAYRAVAERFEAMIAR
jgi:hypothetical protein